MREKIRRFLARHRRHWLVGKIGRNLGYYHQGFENQDYDMATNGEKFVMDSLAMIYPRALIIDVGAHHGEWAALAAAAVPQGKIHSFEVIPSTYQILARTCANIGNVTPHQMGLGESDGLLEFSVATGRDDLSSGLAGVHGQMHRFDFKSVQCPVMTGHRFCHEHGVEQVDFLKLDVEGLEPAVLRGFLPLLDQQRIRMVQFEYGQINLQARFFLGDFYEMLGSRGMKLGKIFPSYVDFREYHFTADTLSGPNYLAVDAGEHELIRLLQGAS